jgi:hypothetical protein
MDAAAACRNAENTLVFPPSAAFSFLAIPYNRSSY